MTHLATLPIITPTYFSDPNMVSIEEYYAVHSSPIYIGLFIVVVLPLLLTWSPCCSCCWGTCHKKWMDKFTSLLDAEYSESTGWRRQRIGSRAWLGYCLVGMFIPVVVVKNAVLDHDYFRITGSNERNRSQFTWTESATLEGNDGSGIEDGSAWKANVVYAHPEICNALSAGFDCFQDTGESNPHYWKGRTGGQSNTNGNGVIGYRTDNFKSCDSLSTEPAGEEYPCHIFERDHAVSCSIFGMIELKKKTHDSENMTARAELITAGNFDVGIGVKCYRFVTPSPVDYLDGFGIAAGLVALFLYLFDLMDRIFDIGKPEPTSKSRWKRVYALWAIFLGSIALTVYMLYFCIDEATQNKISSLTAIADYLVPAVCIEIWMIWFTLYVR